MGVELSPAGRVVSGAQVPVLDAHRRGEIARVLVARALLVPDRFGHGVVEGLFGRIDLEGAAELAHRLGDGAPGVVVGAPSGRLLRDGRAAQEQRHHEAGHRDEQDHARRHRALLRRAHGPEEGLPARLAERIGFDVPRRFGRGRRRGTARARSRIGTAAALAGRWTVAGNECGRPCRPGPWHPRGWSRCDARPDGPRTRREDRARGGGWDLGAGSWPCGPNRTGHGRAGPCTPPRSIGSSRGSGRIVSTRSPTDLYDR